MRNLFLFISLCIFFGFLNEWGKLNVNFYLEITTDENWNRCSPDERQMIITQKCDQLSSAYYYQVVDPGDLISMESTSWLYLKWMVPVLGTMVFFILEWYFLPLIFSNNWVTRKHVFYYYGCVLFIVLLMFAIFKVSNNQSFLIISRRIWLILQGPSLFVLFWCYQLFKRNG